MKITKAVWALLPVALQSTFTADPTDPEQYDNGEENAASLKTALEHEKAAKVKAAQERDQYKNGEAAKLKQAKEDALKEAREKGDFARIEEDYKTRMAALEAKATAAEEKYNSAEISRAKEAVISELLPVFVSAKAGRAILEGRIRVEMVDGKPVTRFLDDAGNPTSIDAKTFQKNLVDDADLKSVIKATNGSGGGATGSNGGGGATPSKLADFKNLTEETIFANANPEAYQKMVEAASND